MTYDMVFNSLAIVLAACAAVTWLMAYNSYIGYRAARESAALRRMAKTEMEKIRATPGLPEAAYDLSSMHIALLSDRKALTERMQAIKDMARASSARADMERGAAAVRDSLTPELRKKFEEIFPIMFIALALEDSKSSRRALKLVRLHREENRLKHKVVPPTNDFVGIAFSSRPAPEPRELCSA